MHKKITIIHTTIATVTSIPVLIKKMYDDFDIVNILDDSMLNDIKEKGYLTKDVIERFVQYVIISKNNGSDAILLACSSIGEAGNIARKIIDIPLFKIDEPMAELAVKKGKRILVLGTVQSTLLPTSKLIKSKVTDTAQTVECKLIPDVFELYTINREKHDQKIAEVIEENQDKFDVIVLAQASMSGATHYIDDKRTEILTSLPLGLIQLKDIVEKKS